MSTDFFDDDVLRAGPSRPSGDEDESLSSQPALGASLGRVARQREEMSNQVMGKAKEIERLKHRQEDLEREREMLAEFVKKQEQYERDKQDIIDRLGRSVVLLEKEEAQAARMVEVFSETRNRFRGLLSELKAIDEETWSEQVFSSELTKAAALVENARMEYEKSSAKIEAADWNKAVGAQVPGMETAYEGTGEKDFNYWARVGFAFSLPVIAVMVTLFLLALVILRK